MALPNPGMVFTPFDPLPASDLNDLVENIESLADGTGFDAGAIGTADIADDAVTPAKWTNPYCFRAYASGSTSLVDNTPTKIALATESYDYNNDFTGSTYTAPVAGVYNFSATFQLTTAVVSGVTAQAMIYVNGSEYASGAVVLPTNTSGCSVAGDVLLAANDTVEFYGLQDSGGNEAIVTSSTRTWFSGHLVHAV